MTTVKLERLTNWDIVRQAAGDTVGKNLTGEPTTEWKHRMLLAEHSPIRLLKYKWTWCDLPYWVSVHFVRHKIGIEHFVQTQRTDRTGVKRDKLPQGALVTHTCEANAQTIINISRKRLCNFASPETRSAWKMVLEQVEKVDPELYSVCVPECIYRGFCPEFRSCWGFYTEEFKIIRRFYTKLAKKSKGTK